MNAASLVRRAGFTLMEVMVASTVSVIVIAGVTGAFIEGLQVWQQEQIKNELSFNLENAMERIRADLRLSSVGVGLMSFYPATSAQYTAISIPLSVDMNNDNLLDRNTNGTIVWNQTIIYHVRPGTPDQLLRTVYDPRSSNATPDLVYSQLVNVVAASNTAGLQAAALPGEVCTSKLVFENLVDLRFVAPENKFDCYSSVPTRAPTHNFGSVVLPSGPHKIELKVVGKNANSSGYVVPIDKVQLSYSAGYLDAELFYPINSHPSSPCFGYTLTGGSLSAFEADNEWSGVAGILFSPSAVDQTLTLGVTNDYFNDNNFELPDMVSNCQVVITDTNYFPGDVVVQLKKGTAWSAGGVGPRFATMSVDSLMAFTNILHSASNNPSCSIMLDGCWARFMFERGGSNFSLVVTNAQVMNANATIVSNITFNGGQSFVYMPMNGPLQTNSDWVPMWEIFRESNCLVRFQTMNTGDKDYDLFVGQQASSRVRFFKNEGATNAYSFPGYINDWQNIDAPATYAPAPTFGDVDSDGDYDLLIGKGGGVALTYWKNVGDRLNMVLQNAGNVPGCNCDYSRPRLIDFDNDGLLDLFIGHKGGGVDYKKNTGTATAPAWPDITKKTVGSVVGGFAAPAVADINADGLYEVFAGSLGGTITMWTNSGTATNPTFLLATNSYSDLQHDSGYTAPAFCDINGDGRIDLFLGANDSSVWYFENTGSFTVAAWKAPNKTFASGTGGYAVPTFCNIDNDFNGVALWGGASNIVYSYGGGGFAGVASPNSVSLAGLEVGYPKKGAFRSRGHDTKMGSASFKKLSYTCTEGNGGNVAIKLRSGNNPSPATAWSAPIELNENLTLTSSDVGNARFIQYQAELECGLGGNTAAHTNGPSATLRDVTISWPASSGLVDLQVVFGQRPNGGIVSATVDGQLLVKGVQVDMTIYKAGRLGTNIASGTLEVRPLNTGR